MANTCYTKYCFEGPEIEIRNIGNHLLQTFAQHPFEEADEETKQFSTPEYYQQHFEHIVTALEMRIVFDCRGAVKGEIADDTYCDLGDGNMGLAVQTESAWSPANDIWDAVIAKWAPHSRYYYYAEEIAVEGAWSNDLDRKYFPWDFITAANFKGPVPEAIHDFLTKKSVPQDREYYAYTTYWTKAELREAILKFLPHPEWDTDKLIYIARNELQRFADEGRMWLYFLPVRHCLDEGPKLYSEEDIEKLKKLCDELKIDEK